MRRSLHRNAVWTGVATGVPFGLVMGVMGRVQDGSWAFSVVGGVVGGVFFGVGMGVFFARQRSTLRAALAGSGPDDRRAALLRFRLDALERQKVWSTALYAVVIATSTAGALAGTTWQWAVAALFVVLLVFTWVQHRRLRRQVTALDGGQPVR